MSRPKATGQDRVTRITTTIPVWAKEFLAAHGGPSKAITELTRAEILRATGIVQAELIKIEGNNEHETGRSNS